MAAAKKTSKSSRASGARQTGTRSRSRSTSNTTTDHDEIREWAEQRQGTPACVRGTGGRGDVGVLRIDFPGGAERSLQKMSWEEWFRKFDERGLVFLHQDKTASGRTSRFNKLISKETAAETGNRKTLSAGRK